MMRRIRPIVLLLFMQVACHLVNAQEAPLAGFDDYVVRAMRDWKVPGLAVAVVKDDRIVFAKGYGVRRIGDPTPVDEHTLFAIGSATKAFTATALAMLVDEGKIKWDDPVTKYLPEFQLFDPYVTREMTIRDLLTHRSGLERADLLWYGAEYDRDEILRRIRYLKPAWSFRSRFGYQNIMFLAAGQIVAKVSGKSWDEFVKERIFVPLGMTASNTSVKDLKGDVASPHVEVEGEIETIPWRNIDNIAPAGSINSNIVDMARWVRLHLGQGVYGNRRIVSVEAIREIQTPQMVIRLEHPYSMWYPEAHFLNYGLGWFLSDYRGRKVVEHGGAIDGMRAEVALIPEEKLGLAILTNMNGTLLPVAIMYRIFDAYLGAPERDWSAELLKTVKAFEEQNRAAERKLEAERVQGTHPSLALEKYAGTYRNDLYGEVRVTYERGKLSIRFGPAFTSELEHWHYDTFRARFRGASASTAYVTFTLNARGRVEELKLSLPGLADYPFKRVAEATNASGSPRERNSKRAARGSANAIVRQRHWYLSDRVGLGERDFS